MSNEKEKTTLRIKKITIVKQHMLNLEEKTLNGYINKLIKQDILKNGDEYIITKYFKDL